GRFEPAQLGRSESGERAVLTKLDDRRRNAERPPGKAIGRDRELGRRRECDAVDRDRAIAFRGRRNEHHVRQRLDPASMNSNCVKRDAGLSLTELLVVSAILLILTALVYGIFRMES